jgi:hypothetical protein
MPRWLRIILALVAGLAAACLTLALIAQKGANGFHMVFLPIMIGALFFRLILWLTSPPGLRPPQ